MNVQNGRHSVRMWYPDVLHYNSTTVSPKVHLNISSYSQDLLRRDRQLREKLNRMLLQDMMEVMLRRLFGTVLRDYDLRTLHVMTGWISPTEDATITE